MQLKPEVYQGWEWETAEAKAWLNLRLPLRERWRQAAEAADALRDFWKGMVELEPGRPPEDIQVLELPKGQVSGHRRSRSNHRVKQLKRPTTQE